MNSEIKARIDKINEGIVPEGYKKTKVGIIPEDWEVKKLGDIRDTNDRHSFAGGPFGSNLMVKDYCKRGIRIIQLQNIGDGYFDDNNRIYTSVEKADELISSNIYPGDIIIAKMAEPLARACIIPNKEDRYLMASDGIRLKLNKENNELYIKEIINSKKFRNKAYQLGTGTTRKRINLTDLRKMEVPNPTLQEQAEIANILSTWDKAIEKIEKLTKEKELQKKGLMQQLLTGETRLPGFNGEWKEVKLGEVLDYEQPDKYTTNNINDEKTKNKKYPVLTANKTFILGYTDDKEGVYVDNPVIIFDDFTTASRYVDFNFKIRSSAIKLLKNKEDINLRFIFDRMQLIKYPMGGHKRYYISEYQFIKLNLPPLPEQEAIANILSTADKEISLLKELLENKKQEKKGLMQLLLTGIIRV